MVSAQSGNIKFRVKKKRRTERVRRLLHCGGLLGPELGMMSLFKRQIDSQMSDRNSHKGVVAHYGLGWRQGFVEEQKLKPFATTFG